MVHSSTQPLLHTAILAHALPVPAVASTQTVTFYDSRGEFVGVRRLGSGKAIEVEGMTIRPQVRGEGMERGGASQAPSKPV